MFFLMHLIAALISLIAIILACSLFTNAIENLGEKLKIGNKATGSILAVIGTGLPETIVPLVAIFGAYLLNENPQTAKNIAIGAIIGSPFILSTFALFLLGVILFFKKRAKKELNIDYKYVVRDFKYFLTAYGVIVLASFVQNQFIKILMVIFLILFYITFAYRTILRSRLSLCEEKGCELIFCKIFRCKIKNEYFCILLQLFASIAALALFSRLFVVEIEFFSNILKISPVILSLFTVPVATELPECVNSVIWLKDDKDELALANITGAIIFQAMVPASIGILLTSWQFNCALYLNTVFVFVCSVIFLFSVLFTKKVKLFSLILCGLFYFGFLGLILIK